MVKKDAKTRDLIKATLKIIATHEKDDWPPKCAGLLFQPQRPQKQSDHIPNTRK